MVAHRVTETEPAVNGPSHMPAPLRVPKHSKVLPTIPTGRKAKHALTSVRKDIVEDFLKYWLADPELYGEVGTRRWITSLLDHKYHSGSKRLKHSNVTHTDVEIWLEDNNNFREDIARLRIELDIDEDEDEDEDETATATTSATGAGHSDSFPFREPVSSSNSMDTQVRDNRHPPSPPQSSMMCPPPSLAESVITPSQADDALVNQLMGAYGINFGGGNSESRSTLTASATATATCPNKRRRIDDDNDDDVTQNRSQSQHTPIPVNLASVKVEPAEPMPSLGRFRGGGTGLDLQGRKLVQRLLLTAEKLSAMEKVRSDAEMNLYMRIISHLLRELENRAYRDA